MKPKPFDSVYASMRVFFVVFTLFLSINAFAVVEMRSLYYVAYESKPIQGTNKLLDSLLQLIENQEAQIIEINAFVESDRDEWFCEVLARKRILYVLEYLNVKGEPITKHPYGKQRIDIPFTPFNWNRVDIYYNVEDPPRIVDTHVEEPRLDEDLTDTQKEPERPLKVPEAEGIAENVPILIPIIFKGGTTDIKPESEKYLKHLYQTMEKHPELNAHIRGHVCCHNKKLKSRKRAKKVYKYLVNAGIDKERLTFKGYSNREPLVWPEKSVSDREQNRRVEVVFTKNL